MGDGNVATLHQHGVALNNPAARQRHRHVVTAAHHVGRFIRRYLIQHHFLGGFGIVPGGIDHAGQHRPVRAVCLPVNKRPFVAVNHRFKPGFPAICRDQHLAARFQRRGEMAADQTTGLTIVSNKVAAADAGVMGHRIHHRAAYRGFGINGDFPLRGRRASHTGRALEYRRQGQLRAVVLCRQGVVP